MEPAQLTLVQAVHDQDEKSGVSDSAAEAPLAPLRKVWELTSVAVPTTASISLPPIVPCLESCREHSEHLLCGTFVAV